MKHLSYIFIALALSFSAEFAYSRISISPFVSMSSTKKIKPEAKGTEKETLKQRTTYGVRANVSFWRLFKLQFSVGQNELVTTEKVSEAKDEFDEIDYEEDLDMSTDDPDSEVKITDKMIKARLGIVLDPGFWIFIARTKVGVQATKRTVTLEENGKEPVTDEPPITYKPYAGAGAGIKFTPRMYFMAEYNFFFYKFPETEPFEREVSVSFNVSI